MSSTQEELMETSISNLEISSSNLEEMLSHPETLSSNLEASDLDQETVEKLKGDCIGNTTYSESFIIKTLMKLYNVKWNDDLEKDLCYLWEIANDIEVAQYLYQMRFPTIVYKLFQTNRENDRLLELTLGILANLVSAQMPKDKIELGKDEVDLLFHELQNLSENTEVQIQKFRFIRGFLYNLEGYEYVSDVLINCVIFILNNCENKDLLEEAILLTRFFKKHTVDITSHVHHFLEGICLSWDILIPTFSEEYYVYINYHYDILENLTHFYKEDVNVQSMVDEQCKRQIHKINVFTQNIIRYFSSDLSRLVDFNDEIKGVFQCLFYLCESAIIKYHKESFMNVLKMVEHMVEEKTLEGLIEITMPVCGWLHYCKLHETDMHQVIANDLRGVTSLDVNYMITVITTMVTEPVLTDIGGEILGLLEQN